ncbi:ABC transporter ATP-binding protein [Desulfitobacterium chlororespirans]|uniref:Oligopeptide/dipeptide ABC transporter, ATP-binding protein, C-terminal domain-containing protein n=1 Tax=Desulfitobacterium chlororespirans DSM 11544 TaxID=1121395 RepID=A0A1M7ULD3_9FIRM|nr:ABC transporter ATP-binding protein [Desulfitobacterium chlororespirans]SHN83842.1 oligopeptide/dipeptide ABC transporter, ATP-binding protein, C-terminal domain-containing protein [Desulfitobacterium chlororespirans DSM 11544]
MSEVILEGQGLTRRYTTDTGRVLTACRNVDITLSVGETLGIVGESGCGKSTLLRLLTRLEKPDEGKLLFRGKDVTGLKGEALRRDRRHIQMVFQDPAAAFFPRMKAGEAIIEPLLNFNRLSRQQRLKRQEELLELVQLPKDYAGRYPHSMSGGQRQRLGIARALALDPEILICDEATAALDVSVQKRIIDLLMELQRRRRLGIIFVSHDLALVQSIAHRVMVMYLGGVVECLPGEQVWERACHPYSRALINSVFTVDMDFTKPITLLEGDIPSPLDMPQGCAFHVRCPQRMEQCRQVAPPFYQIAPHHRVACHLFAHQKKG